MLRKLLLSSLVLTVFLLHQDSWNWTKTEPLVFGFLPIGLAYHAGHAILSAILMAVLVKFAWPDDVARIESELDPQDNSPMP
jgi:hypothetical protein